MILGGKVIEILMSISNFSILWEILYKCILSGAGKIANLHFQTFCIRNYIARCQGSSSCQVSLYLRMRKYLQILSMSLRFVYQFEK